MLGTAIIVAVCACLSAALILSSVIVGIKLGCLSLLFSISTYEDRGNGVLSRMVVHLLIAVENSTAHWLKKQL